MDLIVYYYIGILAIIAIIGLVKLFWGKDELQNKDLLTAFHTHYWVAHWGPRGARIHVDKGFLIPVINQEPYEFLIGAHLCVPNCYCFICFIIAAVFQQPWYILAASGLAGFLLGFVFLFIPEIFLLNYVTLLYAGLQHFYLPIIAPIVLSFVFKDKMIIIMYLAVLFVRAFIISPPLYSITRKISMKKYGLPYSPIDYKAFVEAKRSFRSHFRIALMFGSLPAFYKTYLESEIENEKYMKV